MKIALAIERMDTSRGGRETSTAQIASELARRGQSVTILCQSGSLAAEGVSVRTLGQSGLGRTARMRNFVEAVGQIARSDEFDIVHTMLPVPDAQVYQPRGGTIPGQIEASLRRRRGIAKALCVMAEPLNFCRQLQRELEVGVERDKRTACLCVSRMIADEFRRFYRREENVRVVYNAVQMPEATAGQRADWRREFRAKAGADEGTTVFITIATNFALKGVGEAIAAMAAWRRKAARSARLVVIGGRDGSDSYRRQAASAGVAGSVVFIPPTADVLPWYAAADAVLLLSWYDPCSRVVLEAVTLGVPCITTAFNGAAEVLAGGAGLVVPSPDDQAAVAAAMDELSDPGRREAAAAACASIAPTLGMRRHVDMLLDVYAEVQRK